MQSLFFWVINKNNVILELYRIGWHENSDLGNYFTFLGDGFTILIKPVKLNQ